MLEIKGLIFDMDGVLAEVSRSYRSAIVQTAALHGVQVTLEEIENEKIKGNANNDWILTKRMIEAKGVKVSLEKVTNDFEDLYQGLNGHDGLYKLESLIPVKGLLLEIHRRLSKNLAIVTGRPRKDCMKFLQHHGLEHLFEICICMEDCPAKPDPTPVNLAIVHMKLKPNEVAMIGDTIDDILATVSAGAIPIGVITPDAYARSVVDNQEPRMKQILQNKGATIVLNPGLSELLDLILPVHEIFSIQSTIKISRKAKVYRKTKETSIEVDLNLDGSGISDINTGIGFLDHMLTALSKHSRMDILLKCKGDTWIDDHHSAEDCAITLGETFDKALGKRCGIRRFGEAIVPLDEALTRAVVDISSRPHCTTQLHLKRDYIGTLSCEMIPHIFESFAIGSRITLHVDVLRGTNDHHKAESAFKAVAIALRNAISKDNTADIPSTKEYLD